MKATTIAPGTYFWQGNVACVEGALAAGCKFYAGYPITPANEIGERTSERMFQVGGLSIQLEDEIASIAAVIGASWGGLKSMTATSGPGFSLMQENIGLAIMSETPCVIVDVQRVGPSTGQSTMCAQGDIMQARWGTHGDHEIVALTPNSVQEMFDLTIRAFDIAERLRTPVVILADEITAHLRERIDVPDKIDAIDRVELLEGPFFSSDNRIVRGMPPLGRGLAISVTGSTHDPQGMRRSSDPEVHRSLVEGLAAKIRNEVEWLSDVELSHTDDCEVGVISFGATSRGVQDAVVEARERGIKAGHLRLRTIWPFPEKEVKRLCESSHTVLVPEMNLGQVYLEVQRVTPRETRIIPLNKIGGSRMFTPTEILTEIERRVKR